MASYAALTEEIREPLAADADLMECVRFATLAANSHNTQPWRFDLSANKVAILPDLARRTPAVDPDDHHLHASLGCAAENLLIAARARGLHGAVEARTDGAVAIAFDAGRPEATDLFAAIPKRQCTRSNYSGRTLPASDLSLLEQAAAGDGIRLVFLMEKPRIENVLEYVLSANTAQMEDDAFLSELKHWLRFNEAQALAARDGLFSACSGNPALPGWLVPLVFPLAFTTSGENDRYAAQIRSSSGIAVFVSARNDRAHWIEAGRSFQRFALKATALGIAHAFVNQPVEVAASRSEFAGWLGLGAEERPDFIVRFGYAPPLPMSLRRDVRDVMV